MKNLYFGDNLDIMKRLHKEHPEGFIDLIYIDPPFNSKRNYNVLFEAVDLSDTKAQKEAFADTWSNVSYNDTLLEIQELDLDLYKFLQALNEIRISKSAISYLTTMSIRILYMHKLLKSTGSFYLHCDSTMSHYLKLVCDLIFGGNNFRSEITWQRTNIHNDAKKHLSNVSDVILYYTSSSIYKFFPQYNSLNEDYIKSFYRFDDNDGRGKYRISDLASPNPRPNLTYEYKGYKPPANGWAVSKEKMELMASENKIYYPKKIDGRLQRKTFLKDSKGILISNIWTDINPVSSQDKEKLGYPTQKPITLMERILKISSNEGDLVADFFCGCGTTIAAAEKLNRNWLGVDISHLAVKLVIERLLSPYPEEKQKEIRNSIWIDGLPKDIASAKELARNTDKHRVQFQDWIIEFIIGGVSNIKKSGDGGYDGYLTFPLSDFEKKKGLAIIEVKSGNVGVHTIRAFMDVVEKQKADMGIFVCFENQVSSGMRIEANNKGKIGNSPKIQIITVEDLLNGNKPQLPYLSQPQVFTKATQRLDKKENTERLF